VLVDETFITTDDGARLWLASSGDGPPVVLCHGGPGYWNTLEPVASMLDDRFTVHLWDQRGAGRSAHAGPYTVARFVADLDAIRNHFGYESWTVGGHSWGASLALLYALKHQSRTAALLSLCGTGLAWSQGPRQAYGAERLARLGDKAARYQELRASVRSPWDRELRLLTESTNYFDRASADALAARHIDERFTVNAEVNASLNLEAFGLDEMTLAARCAGLDVPTLVLLGEGDPRPLWACDSLVAALPQVTRVIVPRAGHEPWLENAAETRAALRSFLLRE
jgi:proline iminopeptidase